VRRAILASVILLTCSPLLMCSDGGSDPSPLNNDAGTHPSPDDVLCSPGDLHACVCGGSSSGTQTCLSNAVAYGPCVCAMGGGAGAGGAGAASGGGAGGGGPGAMSGAGGSVDAGIAGSVGLTDAGLAGSTGMPPAPLFPGAVGTPCDSDQACAGAPLVCVRASSNVEFQTGGPQGGYCSAPCATDDDCRALDDISACNTALGFCFALCVPGNSAIKCGSDRAQVCFPIQADTLGACIPRCTSDAACGAGRFCDPSIGGLCVDQQPAGGKVGDPCSVANEATDCAGGLCLEYSDPSNLQVSVGSFCSANCTFGLANGCGFDNVSGGVRQAACLQAQLSGGQPGDIGYCFPLCDSSEDCAQTDAGWVCSLFNDPVAEAQVGRLGECLPAELANTGDAGP
jgi:hypothetical protein